MKRIVLFTLSVVVLFANSCLKTTTDHPYVWDQVPTGGCGWISGIVAHPLGQNVLYGRIDVGGGLRWNEPNQRWIPITDMFPSTVALAYQSIESINVDPSDINAVYIASGRNGGGGAIKPVILRSNDRGNSWTDTGWDGGFIAGNTDYRWCGERLAVDPNNSNIVYYGSQMNGLWINKNPTVSGNWVQVPVEKIPLGSGTGGVLTNQNAIGVSFVTFDPSGGVTDGKTKIIYVGVWGEGMYKSADAGETWNRMAGGPKFPMRGAISADGAIVVTEQGNGQAGQNFRTGAVYYCPNGGAFEKVALPDAGYAPVAVDPKNPNIVLIVTQSGGENASIYKSTDAGRTFNEVHKVRGHSEAPWFPKNYFIARPSSIVFDPAHPGRVWISCWYTTWRTENIYADPVVFNTAVRGHEGFAVRFLMSPPSGVSMLFFGIGDSGGFRHWSPTEYPDQLIGPSDVNMVDYHYNNPDIMYRVGFHRNRLDGGLMKSTDNGVTWSDYLNVTLPKDIKLDKGCKTMIGGRIVVSATDPNRLVWLPYRVSEPYTSGDGGLTWAACKGVEPVDIKNLIPSSYTQSQPLAASKAGSNYMYYATSGDDDLKFYTSSDGGVNFTRTGAGLPNEKSANWMVKAVPRQDGGVWISLGQGGLYASSDFGATFTKLQGVANCTAYGFGKSGSNAPSVVYMVGRLTGDTQPEHRIYRSDDMGKTWIRINDEDHKYGVVLNIEGDGQIYGRVFLGNSGRGIIYGRDPSIIKI